MNLIFRKWVIASAVFFALVSPAMAEGEKFFPLTGKTALGAPAPARFLPVQADRVVAPLRKTLPRPAASSAPHVPVATKSLPEATARHILDLFQP